MHLDQLMFNHYVKFILFLYNLGHRHLARASSMVKIDKVEISGLIVLFMGAILLAFTFYSAYTFLIGKLNILGSQDLIAVFGNALGPLIEAIVRILYLGIMGWMGSIITIRAVQLLKMEKETTPVQTQIPTKAPTPTPIKAEEKAPTKPENKEEEKLEPKTEEKEKSEPEQQEKAEQPDTTPLAPVPAIPAT